MAAMSTTVSIRLTASRPVLGHRSQAARPVCRSARSVRVMAGDLLSTAESNGFSKFAAAVRSTGVDREIASGNFTFFAPTDAAMDAMTNPGNLDLAEIVKYHICKGKTQGRHVENFPSIPTIEGTPIAVDIRSQKPDIVVGPAPQGMQGLAGAVVGGKIVSKDLAADNGIIHGIDTVMMPEPPLVGQNGGYVAGTEPGSGEGRTGLDTKVTRNY